MAVCEEPQQGNKDLLEIDDSDTETLSLCDLPLNSKASDLEGYYSSSSSSSSSSSKEGQSTSCDHQDFFEFFSEEFTDTITYHSPKDDIMFCGKLITHKESQVPIKAHDSMANNIKAESAKKSQLLAWRSLNMPKTSSWTTKQECFEEVPYKGGRVKDFPMKKTSVLASLMRSRWYVLAFGVGRFPMEMELMDMKTTQRKKRQARGYPSKDSSPVVKSSNRGSSNSSSINKNSNSRVSSRAKKTWSMLDIFGCRNQHDNVVVKASIGSLRTVRREINGRLEMNV